MPLNLCLVLLLTSCVRTGTKYVPVPPVPIPVSLLADCAVPLIPDPLTWGDSLELNERLLNALEQCNHDKTAIRQIERERQK
ncbi:peptidase (plasmid) [Pantoea agglomerans]|uniref:Rz1-like lysis system protein LysC n=1 Tax=Enterobacter agglomerans TaxID=549 RepID=UPI0010097BA8|nr:peptidase [Pantoea agglomerans]QAV51444.1 peptidase [Pantoea agglomerans]